jgi:hypothetical protein
VLGGSDVDRVGCGGGYGGKPADRGDGNGGSGTAECV